MAKQIQTIRRQFAHELFVFDHFVGLKLKGLTLSNATYPRYTFHECCHIYTLCNLE